MGLIVVSVRWGSAWWKMIGIHFLPYIELIFHGA